MDEIKLKKAILRRDKADTKIIKESMVMRNEIREGLNEGRDIFGYTMGMLNVIDIVEVASECAGGECDLALSTWSIAQADVMKLGALKDQGLIQNCKLIIDPSVGSRRPAEVELLYHMFGREAVRSVNTHAKFVVLQGKKKTLTVLSTMNFTKNPRIEQFQCIHGDDIAVTTMDMVNDIWDKCDPYENFTTQAMDNFEKLRERMQGNLDLDDTMDLSMNTFSAL
tara:strand:- start:13002 stop:13673 length:672 start_codon:yes stop_codon:yes gene_type:complete